jgi:hypothetical protein
MTPKKALLVKKIFQGSAEMYMMDGLIPEDWPGCLQERRSKTYDAYVRVPQGLFNIVVDKVRAALAKER